MLIIHHARLSDRTEPVDIRISDGVIRAVTPAGGGRRGKDDTVIDAQGARVVPGLHDHHVHLRAWAAALDSVAVGPPDVNDEAALAAALRRPGPGWLRAVGYHDSVAGPLDRSRLDELVPHRPVRLQHRSGALWVLNSRALQAVGPLPDGPGVERDAAGSPTGRLFRLDQWLAGRLPETVRDSAAVSALAAGHGVTGFTEAGPEPGLEMLAWLATEKASGRLRQRLVVMAPSPAMGEAPAADSSDGAGAEPAAGYQWGPVKFLLDDVDLPGLDALAARFRSAHAAGSPVAVHCVTAAQLWLTLSALAESGPRAGDRIEHGAVIPDEAVDRLSALGVAVVTNPGLVRHRGDQYLAEVDPPERAILYRAASLMARGVTVAGGTDAPFGPGSPWEAVGAAVERRSLSGAEVVPAERLAPEEALALFLADPLHLGRRRELGPGADADLCVLNGGRLSDVITTADPVAFTLIGGEIVHGF